LKAEQGAGTVKRRIEQRAERANPVSLVHYWESPPSAGATIKLSTHLEVYSTVHSHAVEALPNETGGFLLGHVKHDPVRGVWQIEIDETLPVEPLTQDPVHFSFGWRDVDNVRSHREQQGKALIGWYHTHPDLGIFLSDTDLNKTHRILFGEPFQIALVYDPVRHRAGYFFWEGPQNIDPSTAPWREFALAVAPAPPDEAPADEPPTPAAPLDAAESALAIDEDSVQPS
jgi:proteasome lid subunit RPN8/RPN11